MGKAANKQTVKASGAVKGAVDGRGGLYYVCDGGGGGGRGQFHPGNRAPPALKPRPVPTWLRVR